MKSQKILLTLFSITALLLLGSLSLNIYQYLQIRGMSGTIVSKDNIQTNSSTDSSAATSKNMKQEIATSNKKNKTDPDKINELEYQLGAAEEETSVAYGQLSDELAKKEEFKKARDKLSKSILSDSSLNMARESTAKRMADDYDPLIHRLNLSEEEAKTLKDLLFEKGKGGFISIVGITSEEEKRDMMKKVTENTMNYENKIRALLGEDQFRTYQDYSNRIPDRRNLTEFMESLPSDNKMSDEQVDRLIDVMYDARVSTYSNMPTGITSTAKNPSEMRKQMLESQKLTNEKYLEASRGIMSPVQVEQYKNYLRKKTEEIESMMKMGEYLNE
jgi:hypothetical protein